MLSASTGPGGPRRRPISAASPSTAATFAGREHAPVRDALQRRPTRMKPSPSSGEPGLRSQRAGAARVVQRISSSCRTVAVAPARARPSATWITGAPVDDRDPARRQGWRRSDRACASGRSAGSPPSAVIRAKVRPAGSCPRRGDVPPQAALQRQQQLDAAGAAADDADAGAARALREPARAWPRSGEEAVDRLDRDGVLARAAHVAGVRSRADVEGEQVEGHRRTVAAEHLPAREIEADRLVLVEPRAGEAARAARCRYGSRQTRKGPRSGRAACRNRACQPGG